MVRIFFSQFLQETEKKTSYRSCLSCLKNINIIESIPNKNPESVGSVTSKEDLKIFYCLAYFATTLSAIIRTEIAAGVMPSIRATCPRVAGCILVSFSFNSLDNP